MNTTKSSKDKFLGVIDKVLNVFLAFLMALMVVVVTWQVLTRFVLPEPSSFTEELARFLLIWIGILGAAYAFRTGAHLGLSLFTDKMHGAAKRNTAIVANALCFLFAASVMVYGGFKLVFLTLELNQTSSALGVKVGYIYTVIPISGILICLFALNNIITPSIDEPARADEEPLNLDS